ncbi:unnamed protein product, partial [Iphiclides podalirius]
MELMYRAVLFCLCLKVSICSETYKAAVVTGNFANGLGSFLPQIGGATKQEADIVLLSTDVPASEFCSDAVCRPENYDELVREISSAAKKYNVYIVTHLCERVRCDGGDEVVRSNLVFDRRGGVVTAYKKPLNNQAVCNTTTSETVTFATDFGVDFVLLMGDDVILQDLAALRNVKNLIVTGGSKSDMAYLRANQLIQSLAYVTSANVISDSGVFAGEAGLRNEGGLVQEIGKESGVKSEEIFFGLLDSQAGEDLSRYTIRPLDLKVSREGDRQTVCHGKLCCEFYVKTKTIDTENTPYGFAVFDGIRQVGKNFVGVEVCSLVACATHDRKTCEYGMEEHVNVTFDKISITGNFTGRHSAQFPVVLTSQTSLPSDTFAFVAAPVNDVKQVNVQLSDARDIFKFGILGHDFSKQSLDTFSNETDTKTRDNSDFYEYIFNEEVVEFFDSVWIKLRVLLFIVSVYILEMM